MGILASDSSVLRSYTFHTLIAPIVMLLAGSVACVACGDDAASDNPSNTRHRDGGAGREADDDKGASGSGGASSVVPLPDQTAGKECSTNEDCATGICLRVFAAGFGGENMEAPGGYCSTTCTANADCGAGGTCSGAFAGAGGRCLKSCSAASDCREGYRCVNALGMPVAGGAGMQDPTGGLLGASACEPIPATTQLADGIVGAPCTGAADCGAGRCQTGNEMMMYPGGYCTGACLQDSDCGANGSCTLPLTGGAGTCYRGCQSDKDCREGYRCRLNGNLQQCVPGAAPLADDVVGSACSTDQDCGGAMMSCRAILGTSTATGGYCSLACIEDSDCGVGGTCIGSFGAGLAGILGPTGTCYRACTDASECREGYTCGRPSGVLSLPTMAMQNVCFAAPAQPSDDAGVE
jgi:hypothetical protein